MKLVSAAACRLQKFPSMAVTRAAGFSFLVVAGFVLPRVSFVFCRCVFVCLFSAFSRSAVSFLAMQVLLSYSIRFVSSLSVSRIVDVCLPLSLRSSSLFTAASFAARNRLLVGRR